MNLAIGRQIVRFTIKHPAIRLSTNKYQEEQIAVHATFAGQHV